MAFKAISLDKREWVVLECDPDAEKPTQWEIRPLSARELARTRDLATSYGTDPRNPESMVASFNPNQMAYEVCRAGLCSVKELEGVDNDTKPNVDAVPLEAIRELSGKINRISEAEEQETKN